MATGYFQDKTALIYGGARGIGRSVAREWARRGASIAVADIDEAAAQATAAEIVAAGGRAISVSADVLSEESIVAAAARAEAELGAIDIVLNNVGAMLNGHPEDIPFAEWQRILDLNYYGVVRSVLHFMPAMIERGHGHIVNTASFAGLYPYAASRIPYAAAKAAVIALTENLALYLEPQGVRVSCLVPGPVLTGVMESMTSWTEDCPMRGPGRELVLMLPDSVAVKLSDDIETGGILILSDDTALDLVRARAASPDEFLRGTIDRFAAGDAGIPRIPSAVLDAHE